MNLLNKTFIDNEIDLFLKDISVNYPSFHRDENNQPWFLGLSGENLKFIASFLKSGMRTVETGAGYSTLAFIVKNCEHTAIFPGSASENDGLEKNIRNFCDSKAINHSSFKVLYGKSQDMVHQLVGEYDFVFIDGDHAFPIPFIDFYYLARRLSVGGIIAIDDCNLWTGEVLGKYLMLDRDWEFIGEKDGKTMYFKLLRNFSDKSFSSQPFLLANSRLLPNGFLDRLK